MSNYPAIATTIAITMMIEEIGATITAGTNTTIGEIITTIGEIITTSVVIGARIQLLGTTITAEAIIQTLAEMRALPKGTILISEETRGDATQLLRNSSNALRPSLVCPQ